MNLFKIIPMPDGTMGGYNPAAKEGEWAVPATFFYSTLDPDIAEDRKEVHSAFFGVDSYGFSAWVEVHPISTNDFQRVLNRLAHYLFENGYVDDLEDGFEAAGEELDNAKRIANRPIGTIMIVKRTMTKHGVVENFQMIPRE